MLMMMIVVLVHLRFEFEAACNALAIVGVAVLQELGRFDEILFAGRPGVIEDAGIELYVDVGSPGGGLGKKLA